MSGNFTKFSEIARKPQEPVLPGDDIDLTLEAILPMELIRQHTKTDDDVSVSDALIMLYRASAFEVCEEYTGMIWTKTKTIIQDISNPGHPKKWRSKSRVKLDYPSADGIVFLFGTGIGHRQVMIEPGKRKFSAPVLQEIWDANCCLPCGSNQENWGIKAMYRTGIAKLNDIPSGIKLGCLKFIAWSISNPGDVIETVKNRSGAGESGIIGTNNGAWASGAIEQWRVYVKDAI